MENSDERTELILATLTEAFEPLMKADADAFRTKFRKMAADPFAFYRGSACVFYADMRELRGPLGGRAHESRLDSRRSACGELRHLHELRRRTDVRRQRLRRGLRGALLVGPSPVRCEPRADGLAEGASRGCRARARRPPTCGPTWSACTSTSRKRTTRRTALHLDNAEGHILEVLRSRAPRDAHRAAGTPDRAARRRAPARGAPARARELDDDERERVMEAFASYLETIPPNKRERREIFYDVKDVVGRSGFGIGSAGLAAYNLLIEGRDQAHENDVILTMKQGNVPAASRIVTDRRIRERLRTRGPAHRHQPARAAAAH